MGTQSGDDTIEQSSGSCVGGAWLSDNSVMGKDLNGAKSAGNTVACWDVGGQTAFSQTPAGGVVMNGVER